MISKEAKGDTCTITRRRFMELTAASVGALMLHGPGCGSGSPKYKRSNYKVFSQGQIGSLKIKNRLVRSAALENAGSNGETTDTYIGLFKAMAEGGVGMIISGMMPAVQEDALPTQVHLYDDRFIAELQKVADAVHFLKNDCKIISQVGHFACKYVGGMPVGPTEVPFPLSFEPPKLKALTTGEVEGIITDFADAIRRVRDGGWDGVELHGAHGYLLSMFLSPYTNTRTDKYGGSLDNRVRIIKDIMDQARALVGDDFPILIKLNGDDSRCCPGWPMTENVENGINISNFPALAAEVVKTGVDAVDVSGMNCLKTQLDSPDEQSFFLKYAKVLDVDVPVILTGGNRSIELLEGIIADEAVDFFGLARPLVREPDLPDRWLKGIGEAEARCISCNTCFLNVIPPNAKLLKCAQES